jgi:hypothetical protein
MGRRQIWVHFAILGLAFGGSFAGLNRGPKRGPKIESDVASCRICGGVVACQDTVISKKSQDLEKRKTAARDCAGMLHVLHGASPDLGSFRILGWRRVGVSRVESRTETTGRKLNRMLHRICGGVVACQDTDISKNSQDLESVRRRAGIVWVCCMCLRGTSPDLGSFCIFGLGACGSFAGLNRGPKHGPKIESGVASCRTCGGVVACQDADIS